MCKHYSEQKLFNKKNSEQKPFNTKIFLNGNVLYIDAIEQI